MNMTLDVIWFWFVLGTVSAVYLYLCAAASLKRNKEQANKDRR